MAGAPVYSSRRARRSRRSLVAVTTGIAAAALGACAPAAGAASRIEVLDLPSTRGNIDLALAKTNGPVTKLQARVLLPDGYDEQPGRRWPVVYLLHGIGDGSGQWLARDGGDAQRHAAGLPAIVVMPEGGRGYWIDHYLGNTDRPGARWASYVLEEVVPEIEQRYRIAPGREHHAIGGLSMGGYGAMVLAAQLPGYFGQAVGFSGLYNVRAPEAVALVPFFSQLSYSRLWGRAAGPYSRAVNPIELLDNLRQTTLYVTSGNGQHDPSTGFNPAAMVLGGAAETLGKVDTEAYVRAARRAGLSVTARVHTAGTHSWIHWRRELRDWTATRPLDEAARAAIPSGETSTAFTYRTMQPSGNAWGLGFRFAQRPRTLITITRDGQQVHLAGQGAVTLRPGSAASDATGTGGRPECAVTVTLPARVQLAPGC